VVDKLKETLCRVNVNGQLALHGVTNNHAFFAQVPSGLILFVRTENLLFCSRITVSGSLPSLAAP
jgi:hypothetical protein